MPEVDDLHSYVHWLHDLALDEEAWAIRLEFNSADEYWAQRDEDFDQMKYGEAEWMDCRKDAE